MRRPISRRQTNFNPQDAYTALWLDLSERRNNGPSHLAETSKQLDMTRGPRPSSGNSWRTERAQTIAPPPTRIRRSGSSKPVKPFLSGEFALLTRRASRKPLPAKLAANDCRWASSNRAAIAELILKR